MKKIFLVVTLIFGASLCANAQSDSTFVRDGYTYSSVKSSSSSNQMTKFKYTINGDEYPIWISKNGRCYIVRVSKKTGNEYKQYLGEDISRDICKQLGVTYVEKQ